MKKQFKLLFLGLVIAGSTLHCGKGSFDPEDFSLLNFDAVHVALYIDNAVWPNCKIYTERILKEIGLPYTIINPDTILQGKLIHYSVLLMPGGKPDGYYENLGSTGVFKIRNYVNRGGGYIGICGGAFFAANTIIWRGWAGEPRVYYQIDGGLGIFRGMADGPIEDFAPTYQDFNCGVKIIVKQHPVMTDLPDTLYYLYDHGPMFLTGNDPYDVVLGKSVKGDKAVLVVTEYNYGRIFLTSGHPEVTNAQPCQDLIENAITWCSKQIN